MGVDATALFPGSERFAPFYQLQANGVVTQQGEAPDGLAGRLEMDDRQVLTATLYDTDVITSSGLRSEARLRNYTIGSEYWFSWQMLVDTRTSVGSESQSFAVAQIHPATAHSPPPRFPLLVTMLRGDRLFWTRPAATLPTESSSAVQIHGSPIHIGRWNDMVINARLSISGTGHWQAFVNGARVWGQFALPTAYDDPSGPTFKIGVYNMNDYVSFPRQQARFRHLRVWEGPGTYEVGTGGRVMLPPARVGVSWR